MTTKPLAILALALVLSLLGNAWQWRHAGITSAESRGDLVRTIDANSAAVVTIDSLRASVAECEAGRLEDAYVTGQALRRLGAARAVADAEYKAAAARLAAELSGRCRDWAAQPACGVTP